MSRVLVAVNRLLPLLHDSDVMIQGTVVVLLSTMYTQAPAAAVLNMAFQLQTLHLLHYMLDLIILIMTIIIMMTIILINLQSTLLFIIVSTDLLLVSMTLVLIRTSARFAQKWEIVVFTKVVNANIILGGSQKSPQLRNDVVLLYNRIQKKEKTFLKNYHTWTIWEIMTLYAVLTVKYAKEYWMSEMYKITNKFHVSLHDIDIQSQWLAENVLNHTSILLSNRIQLFFFIVQWIFQTVSVVTSFHLFLIASLSK